MNKKICQLAMALALASLVGCGLKGPLYFPPKDQPQQEQQPAQQTTQDPTTTLQDGSVQNPTPDQPGM
ncbi:lipoprotein [Erwiniaceae bacterium BAC15a-03b]|uniref:LPS-assembly lipoprotein LptM n=1 Tax=Winslowiella arboricola TaxID=2978220 RepID=A0A9J6PJV2_9GAMM|nr:lipoprotein [Winslowiella arboricola]MCU5772198.1 lipoprotein [Winslowiella arboricola]MCU5776053.1 lipoprotein [Winslowiella arboricola]